MALLDPLYRLLGVIAAVNGRMFLIRVNFIPVNVALFILLAFGAITGFEQFEDARHNSATPKTQSLGTLLTTNAAPEQDYVSVRGLLFTGARLEYGTKGSNGELRSVDNAWAPLLDSQSKRALMVELSPTHRRVDDTEAIAVTGMLRPMNTVLRAELSKEGFSYGGVPIDQRYVLMEGEKPASFAPALLLGIGCAMVLLLFVIATVKRNVIFLADKTSERPVPAQAEPSFFVSGKLHLDEKNRQRFVNVPAAIGTLESGELAIVSNIDASSSFMGMKTSERVGMWMLAMRPGSMTEVQPGYIYSGTKRFRAVRFRYVSSMDGASERAVLSATAGDPMFALQG